MLENNACNAARKILAALSLPRVMVSESDFNSQGDSILQPHMLLFGVVAIIAFQMNATV